ncbi:MAG TPA: DUF6789 family protein [Thermomicrobiales bacterium]|nr:DUF6789 family protein [Thermomicrobiales bacterium]
MNRYLIGAVAGVIATAIMTIAIEIGKLVGLLRMPPPEQVAVNVTRRVGMTSRSPEPEFTAGTLVTHHGYGVVVGMLYVAVRRFLPGSSGLAGLVWGAVVWTTAYLGYLPALRLYPWPDDDRPSRTVVMIVAHAVYGTTLVETEKRLRVRM